MIIKRFEEKRIKVTWTLLHICYNSSDFLKYTNMDRRFIDAKELIDYACALLKESFCEDLLSLAVLKETETEDILNALIMLAKSEVCDFSFEFRKFRAMYVLVNLPDETYDFMQGILRITEIWDQLDFPDDSPNTHFCFVDYSLKNYLTLLYENREWLVKEFNCLR